MCVVEFLNKNTRAPRHKNFLEKVLGYLHRTMWKKTWYLGTLMFQEKSHDIYIGEFLNEEFWKNTVFTRIQDALECKTHLKFERRNFKKNYSLEYKTDSYIYHLRPKMSKFGAFFFSMFSVFRRKKGYIFRVSTRSNKLKSVTSVTSVTFPSVTLKFFSVTSQDFSKNQYGDHTAEFITPNSIIKIGAMFYYGFLKN